MLLFEGAWLFAEPRCPVSTPFAIFRLGSEVYEPFQGLCRVSSSSLETVLGVEQLFYELHPRQGNAVLKVPASQMSSRGIRPLLSCEEITATLAIGDADDLDSSSENSGQRLRRWTRLLRSERSLASYEFMREWCHLEGQGIRFTSQENEMHEKVHRSLTQEISQVLQISNGRAGVKLSQWLKPENSLKGKKSNAKR